MRNQEGLCRTGWRRKAFRVLDTRPIPFGRCPVYIMDNFVYSLKGQAAF